MLSVKDAIAKRSTCLHYAKKKVSQKDILAVVDAARRAPSSHNAQDWSFIVIKDQKKIDELFSFCYYGAFYEIPPVVIACVAHPLYDSKKSLQLGDAKCRIPMHKYLNMGFAVDHLVLMATSLGLSTAILSPEVSKVGKILNVPKKSEVVLFVALGYGKPHAKADRKSLREVIHYEKYT